jgi:predicted NUDIX family phosphoesterase
MNKMDEQIIVVPRKALFDFGNLTFQGTETRFDVLKKLEDNIQNNFGVMRRGDAEVNEGFKQPIPYAVIRRGEQIFLYRRLSGGGETKLHDKLSVGVGGHMNFDSPKFMESLKTNLERELDEELHIDTDDLDINIVGFINDDEDEVGRVHICILVVIDVPEGTIVKVKEEDQLEGDFVNLSTLKHKEIYDKLENWSKIVVDTLK